MNLTLDSMRSVKRAPATKRNSNVSFLLGIALRVWAIAAAMPCARAAIFDLQTATVADIQEAMEAGVLAGYPVVDVIVELADGSYHEVDSSEIAFKVAGSMAFKNAMQRAKPKLLEPVMAVEVVTPEEYLGDVMGDLNARRGRVEGLEPRGNAQAIRARVPLATMFGYATDLRSPTQGRATFTMQFDRYEEAPQAIAGEIVAAARAT